jgi:ADP-ribose pyrophosphatase YjhB (NUDIX family)
VPQCHQLSEAQAEERGQEDEISVAGIVIREDGRMLVIRRADNGTWEPPGGVLELGEALEDGVRREVYEETGIMGQVERLSGIYQNTRQHRRLRLPLPARG